jgi:glycine/D-amino acid oxidase-like deaminating enzyme
MKVDYLIVGQGLAGTVLAHTLEQAGKSILVIDADVPSSASKVAAGIYNPITGKRLVKTWMADELFPAAHQFYSAFEQFLHTKFLFPLPIYRPFSHEDERDEWLKKSMGEEFAAYISKEPPHTELAQYINNPIGGIAFQQGGYVEIAGMLELYRTHLIQSQCLLAETFDYQALNHTETGISYKHIQADKIIFCEGFNGKDNPYFNYLPLAGAKGEIIIIKTQEPLPNWIISKGVYVAPTSEGFYRIGATYDWADLDPNITQKGKDELVEKLQAIIKIPFEVIAHQAAIRPTVKDRRPLIGCHADFLNYYIFNGMGTKGVLLAPYFAAHLAQHLLHNTPLLHEVNITRLKS